VDSFKDHYPLQAILLLFCRAALPLSRPTLMYAAGLVRRHRKKIRSHGRLLKPAR
jgi:hypothetical protein